MPCCILRQERITLSRAYVLLGDLVYRSAYMTLAESLRWNLEQLAATRSQSRIYIIVPIQKSMCFEPYARWDTIIMLFSKSSQGNGLLCKERREEVVVRKWYQEKKIAKAIGYCIDEIISRRSRLEKYRIAWLTRTWWFCLLDDVEESRRYVASSNQYQIRAKHIPLSIMEMTSTPLQFHPPHYLICMPHLSLLWQVLLAVYVHVEGTWRESALETNWIAIAIVLC